MNKVLWLASWYPNKTSPSNGDFIQRHAEAVSVYEPVHVIFVVKDEHGIVTDCLRIENFKHGNLSESIAYYKPFISGIKYFDRIVSILTFLNILRKLVISFIKINGIPRLLHVHVAMWAGIVALWLKKKKGVPYIITEHWSGYDRNALENIYNNGWLFRHFLRSVIQNADLLLPVSNRLGKLINTNVSPVKFLQVSNVVNTLYFNTPGYYGDEFRFIHVSSMGHPKNVEGLLHSFSKLLLSHTNWKLIMVGTAPPYLKDKAIRLGLSNFIIWTGEITHEQVAKEMTKSSALVMFSTYENQPCVILEALCCGLPVISTDVGGISEVITADNGMLVISKNESQLLLVLFYLPEKPDEWLTQSEQELLLKRCAYWVSLREAPASVNDKYQTVYVPQKNVLGVESLRQIMTLRSREEYLPYEP